MQIKPAYQGEALLLRWGDTHNGRTLTLQLDEHFGASHPFKGLKCGPNGQRMQVVCVLIDENEQPVSADNAGRHDAVESPVVKSENTSSDSRRTFSSLPRSQQAGIKCRDSDFTTWLYERNVNLWDALAEDQPVTHEPYEIAARVIRQICGVDSRTQLDNSSFPGAQSRFDSLLTDFSVRGIVR